MPSWQPYPWQQETWQRLVQPLQQGRLAHALLLTGGQGSGKLFLAQGFAKKALCREQQDYACGQCKSCLLIQAGSHPDYLLIEPDGKNIKVDQVRAMIEQLNQTAQLGGRKAIIIAPAEAMNISAANALLKCLEEPTANSLILLVSSSPNRLLPTIRSRCQQIIISQPSFEQADTWLQSLVADAADREKLLQLANGNPLLAQSYAEKKILALYEKCQQLICALLQSQVHIVKETEDLLKAAGKTNAEKNDFVEQWLQINQLLLWQIIQQHFIVDKKAEGMQTLSQLITNPIFIQRAYQMLEYLQKCLKEIQGASNPNPQLLVEAVLIRWQTLAA